MDFKTEPTRVYTSPEITVEWRRELCIHCGNCLRGLPTVFDVEAKPWINLDGATADEVRNQVSQCPSKAIYVPEA